MIALLEILAAAGAGLLHAWVYLGCSCFMVACFTLICCSWRSVAVRKIVFVAYFTLTLFYLLSFVAIALFVGFDKEGPRDARHKFETYCRNHSDLYPGDFDTLPECVSFVKFVFIGVFLVCALIEVAIRLLFCKILYWAWTEQAHYQHYRQQQRQHLVRDQ